MLLSKLFLCQVPRSFLFRENARFKILCLNLESKEVIIIDVYRYPNFFSDIRTFYRYIVNCTLFICFISWFAFMPSPMGKGREVYVCWLLHAITVTFLGPCLKCGFFIKRNVSKIFLHNCVRVKFVHMKTSQLQAHAFLVKQWLNLKFAENE